MFNVDVRAPTHVCTYYRKSSEEKSDVRAKTRKYQNFSEGVLRPYLKVPEKLKFGAVNAVYIHACSKFLRDAKSLRNSANF